MRDEPSTETAAAPTTSVEPETASNQTFAAPEVPTAYSDESDVGAADESEEAETAQAAEYQSWLTVWGSAAALLMVGVGLAAAIVLGRYAFANRNTDQPDAATPPTVRPTATRSAVPPTQSAPPAAPPSTSQNPERDGVFLDSLHDRGIGFTNPDAAVYNGKMVCTNLSSGMTVQQVVEALRNSSPALGEKTTAYVTISVRTYCPTYDALLPPGS